MAQDIRNTKQWQRLRAIVLREQPWCSQCGTQYDLTVDHIIALADGGEPFNRDNLRVLCRAHNTGKENRRRAQGGARTATISGGHPAPVGFPPSDAGGFRTSREW